MSPVKKTLVVLASSIESIKLQDDIKDRYDTNFLRFRGVPKGLLPITGRAALSWWHDVAENLFSDIFIVTNAYNFKHFERWANIVDFPRTNVLNSGLSTGVLSDLAFVHRVKHIKGDIVITPSELFCAPSSNNTSFHNMFYNSQNFVHYKKYADNTTLPFAFGMSHDALEKLDDYIDKSIAQVLEDRHHKPAANDWKENLALYIKSQESSTASHQNEFDNSVELFVDYIDSQVTLTEYIEKWSTCLDSVSNAGSFLPFKTDPLHVKAFARVGLMGNPSDGFFGKTMSLLISNFCAEVTLIPNEPTAADRELAAITILPNPVSDPHKFPSIECLVGVSEIDGYETGDRLLQACCKVFYQHCKKSEINIDTRQGFRVMFETNIPRQVGLAGSSAIITALWKALSQFYGVTEENVSLEMQASLVLKVEQDELGIAAGLQDRVIQAFGGLVYMDFDRDYMEIHGHGKYETLDVNLLPKLWLAYVADPEDSGKVHSSVKQRFSNGDKEIIHAMESFASFTEQAKKSLEIKDHKKFAELMTSNFNLRRETYGDLVVGASNLKMIELARQHNCAAKFPGSGGAVVGMWNGDDASTEKRDLLKLRRALESEGYVFIELLPKVYEQK